jgi:hypothetical protein
MTATPQTSLIKCVYCGHQVSRNAVRCPSCATFDFRGVRCAYCQQAFSKQACGWHFYDGLYYYACDACAKGRFTPPPNWQCIECHAALSNLSYREVLVTTRGAFSCPSCGTPSPFGRGPYEGCAKCSFSWFAFQERVERKIGQLSRFYHTFCLEPKSAGGCLILFVTAAALFGSGMFIFKAIWE